MSDQQGETFEMYSRKFDTGISTKYGRIKTVTVEMWDETKLVASSTYVLTDGTVKIRSQSPYSV